ncbi:MAG: aspartate ammonia-lyase [Bifidobacteriaceae bacterium]|jgi:aspartate ammonia-lyase|nr:aspartate ammonia-lyase [Bifidobacteriaceae bacterium]
MNLGPTATRTETDLIGSLEIPAEAYYGINTARAVENFQISGHPIGRHPNLIRALAMVKKAAALANWQVGALPEGKAEAIIAACDRLIAVRDLDGEFPIDVFQGGAGTSTNMNVNEVIANLALEHMGREKGDYATVSPNDDVNMSQSTNDSYPTALRVATILELEALVAELARLQEAFEAKAHEFRRVLKMGRTQLQDAVPMTVGQEFAAFGVLIAEERKHSTAMAELLLEVNLGATAIGTGVNAPKGYAERAVAELARVTGLAVILSPNLIEATSDCGAYVSCHGALKRIAVKLSKISNDLRLLSSGPRAGLNELRLPERQAGSSIMPAKVNPVIPEVVGQVAFKVMGNDIVVTNAAEAGQLQLNAFEPVIAQAVMESISLLRNAARTLRVYCVAGIEVNADVTQGYVSRSIGLVTYLNPVLGHQLGDQIGKEAAARGKSVREVVLEHGYLDDAELDRLLNLDELRPE